MSVLASHRRRWTWLIRTRGALLPFPVPDPVSSASGSRPFFGWLNSIFNKVDPQRIADVGADRAAAEWLLRCGAAVKWKGLATPLKVRRATPIIAVLDLVNSLIPLVTVSHSLFGGPSND